MHQKYARDGLVCISVSLDEDEEAKAEAHKFLIEQKATFANYRLNEEREVWQARWQTKAPPVLFVFDRQGRRAARYTDDSRKSHTPEDVEALVRKLLRATP